MARLTRVEVFVADEIAVVHVMNRTVRRCLLLGDDPVTGNNLDHRKLWRNQQSVHQSRHFGKLFSVVAGQPQRIDEHRSKGSSRRYRMRQETRELMATM